MKPRTRYEIGDNTIQNIVIAVTFVGLIIAAIVI